MPDVDLKVNGTMVKVGLFRTLLDDCSNFEVVEATGIHENDGDSKLVHQFLKVDINVPQEAS